MPPSPSPLARRRVGGRPPGHVPRSPSGSLDARVIHAGGGARVVLRGELDRQCVDALDGLLRDLTEAGEGPVAVDLARVTFVDVAATRCLLGWTRPSPRHGCPVLLRHPPDLFVTITSVLVSSGAPLPPRLARPEAGPGYQPVR